MMWYNTNILEAHGASITLKMETVWSSKMLVSYHIITLCNYPEDHDLNFHCHENPKCLCMLPGFESRSNSVVLVEMRLFL